MSKTKKSRKQEIARPRILVLESGRATARCITAAGGKAIVVDPRSLEAANAALKTWDYDALVLCGGGDIDPRLYGSKRIHPRVYGVHETRDMVEQVAMDDAREHHVPVLGICRGAQMINITAGGDLVQHIGERHRRGMHRILTVRGSILRKIAPQENKRVTTLHHQMIGRVAEGYAITAIAPDQTVEAIESGDRLHLGVQFHPEYDAFAQHSQAIFRWLVVAAAAVAGLPTPQALQSKPRRKTSYQDASAPIRRVKSSGRGKARATNQLALEILGNPPYGAQRLSAEDERFLHQRRRQSRFVDISWVCRDCGIRFDKANDRDDHERVLHGRVEVGT